jgi:hypothetical protein
LHLQQLFSLGFSDTGPSKDRRFPKEKPSQLRQYNAKEFFEPTRANLSVATSQRRHKQDRAGPSLILSG